MMELILGYYAGERHTAILAMGIGAVLLLLALVLWRTSSGVSLARGMVHVFLIAGLFQVVAGFGYSMVVNKRVHEAEQSYSGHTEHDIKQQEIARMRRVIKSGYRGGLVAYTALILVGIALLLLSIDVPARKGIALALLIVGVLGHCVEAFSMQANRQYLKVVETRLII